MLLLQRCTVLSIVVLGSTRTVVLQYYRTRSTCSPSFSMILAIDAPNSFGLLIVLLGVTGTGRAVIRSFDATRILVLAQRPSSLNPRIFRSTPLQNESVK